MRNELNGPERELEEALAGLRPLKPGLDYEAAVFRAGQVTATWKLRVWKVSTLALAAGLAVSVSANLVNLRTSALHPAESHWAAANTAAGPELATPGPASYGVLRTRILNDGLEALPGPTRESSSSELFVYGRANL